MRETLALAVVFIDVNNLNLNEGLVTCVFYQQQIINEKLI